MRYYEKESRIKFTTQDIKMLTMVCDNLKERIVLTELGHYKNMASEDLWFRIVGQFCVMGNANLLAKLLNDKEKSKLFRDAISLKTILSQKDKANYIASVLLTFKATRFHNNQAKNLFKVMNNKNIIIGDSVVLINDLSHKQDFDSIRNELMRRNPSFKMKSASDFMVDLGLSHDVIALDLRIVGFLNTYLDFDQKVEKIQSNKKFYTLIESSLRKECEKLNIKLSVLDRIIFNYLNISAFDYMYLKINLS